MMPITGTKVPRYQSQPTIRYLCDRPFAKTRTEIAAKTIAAATASQTGIVEGNGYMGARFTGQTNILRYATYDINAFSMRRGSGLRSSDITAPARCWTIKLMTLT